MRSARPAVSLPEYLIMKLSNRLLLLAVVVLQPAGQAFAPGQLRLALGIGRVGRLIPGGAAATAASAAQAGVRDDWPVHQLHLAEPVLDQGLERILGRIDGAAVAVTNAPDPHPVDDGVGFAWRGLSLGRGLTSHDMTRHDRAGRNGGRAAEKRTPGYQWVARVWSSHNWISISFCPPGRIHRRAGELSFIGIRVLLSIAGTARQGILRQANREG